MIKKSARSKLVEQKTTNAAKIIDSDAGSGLDPTGTATNLGVGFGEQVVSNYTAPTETNSDSGSNPIGTATNSEAANDEQGATSGDQVASKNLDTSQVMESFTIFTRVIPNPILENITQVVTGKDYEKSNNFQSPMFQHCNAYIKTFGTSRQIMRVAHLKKDALKTIKFRANEIDLSKNKITRKTWDKLYNYCKFEIPE